MLELDYQRFRRAEPAEVALEREQFAVTPDVADEHRHAPAAAKARKHPGVDNIEFRKKLGVALAAAQVVGMGFVAPLHPAVGNDRVVRGCRNVNSGPSGISSVRAFQPPHAGLRSRWTLPA